MVYVEVNMMVVYLKQLKQAYKKAKKEKEKYFVLDKKDFYTKYAKYLIQYLENKGLDDDSPIQFNKGGK